MHVRSKLGFALLSVIESSPLFHYYYFYYYYYYFMYVWFLVVLLVACSPLVFVTIVPYYSSIQGASEQASWWLCRSRAQMSCQSVI